MPVRLRAQIKQIQEIEMTVKLDGLSIADLRALKASADERIKTLQTENNSQEVKKVEAEILQLYKDVQKLEKGQKVRFTATVELDFQPELNFSTVESFARSIANGEFGDGDICERNVSGTVVSVVCEGLDKAELKRATYLLDNAIEQVVDNACSDIEIFLPTTYKEQLSSIEGACEDLETRLGELQYQDEDGDVLSKLTFQPKKAAPKKVAKKK